MVKALRAAGIRLTVVTGDHAGTARVAAARFGLLRDTPAVVEGRRLDEVLASADTGEVGVFARVRPEQKLAIVAHLQARGDVVAVTGDGVNDAPALRTADIGVAMGHSGTEVVPMLNTLLGTRPLPLPAVLAVAALALAPALLVGFSRLIRARGTGPR